MSKPAVFVTGSIFRHVAITAATGSVGLIAIFVVDVLNLFYISRLGVSELAAAVGFAGTLMFFTTSLAIGLTIPASAMVARALGAGDRIAAARIGGAALGYSLGASSILAIVLFPFIENLLSLLGAKGETLQLATGFMQIVMPSSPVLAVGMAAAGILRGAGDARRAMNVTLAAAIAAAIFDPLLIYGLELGLNGAAIATFLSRSILLAVGLWAVVRIHRLAAFPDRASLIDGARPFFAIGLPAVLTQVATPFGNAFVTSSIAAYGDAAVSGWAIIGRIVPVAFGAIFALSGAVGPIFGQNFGARAYGRLHDTLRASLILTTGYVAVVWALLALFSGKIAALFAASGDTEALIVFFCLFAAGSFLFNGALFVANAAFNNLGFPALSTLFNWGRSTLGTLPFVWAGSRLYGAEGVIAGWGIGAVAFGLGAMTAAFIVVRRIGSRQNPSPAPATPSPPPA